MNVKHIHKPVGFAALLVLFAVSFASCVFENNVDDIHATDNAFGEENSILYFSVNVRAASGENLELYKDGNEFEHAVDFSGNSQHVIIFFDSDYNYKGYSQLEFDRLSAQGTTNGLTDAEEISFIGFLRHDYTEAYNMEKYGLMVLNAHNITDALDQIPTSATIENVLNLTDISAGKHIAGRSGNYFTLTSTAYLVKESNEWKHSILFGIDPEKVFSIREQAVIQPAATAYVERMASKFSFYVPGKSGNADLEFLPDDGRAQVIVCNYVDGQPYFNNRAWTCTLDAWGINKYEPEEYYFRNIVDENGGATISYPYSYGADISSTFFTDWNKAYDHRCFWAVDPHYRDGVYPVQYRPAVDNYSKINHYGKEAPPSLAYLSYSELSTDFSGLGTTDGAVLYSTENTFPDISLRGTWQHNLAGSELLVGARIHINGVSETVDGYDLYRNRIGVFYPTTTDFAAYFISTFNSQLYSQKTMTYHYYDWDRPANNEEVVLRSQSINYSDYKLYYKDQPLTAETMASLDKFTIPATIENGDGKVIPWVEGMYIGRRNKDLYTGEEIGEIYPLAINENDLKSLIYDWVGPFDHFNKGKMIYAVPIRYRASGDQVSKSTYRPKVGDYGVVRDAWYRFELDEINNLGTPVDDLNQKIIPYEASMENSIMMEIKAIDWHEFNTTVTLPGMQ